MCVNSFALTLNSKMHLSSIASYCDLLNLPAHRQLAMYEVCVKEASRLVLVDLQRDEGGSTQARRMAFSSMSGAICFNIVGLAKKLLSSSDLAKTHLQVIGGIVSSISPGFFDVASGEAHSKYYSDGIGGLRKEMASSSAPANLKRQLKSRVRCYQRLQAVHWPVGKRMAVSGVKICLNDGSSSVLRSAHTSKLP